MNEKGDGTSSAWKATMLVLVGIVIILLSMVVYAEYKGSKVFKDFAKSTTSKITTEEITVEDRMQQFSAEVEDTRMHNVYVSLPPVIVESILTKLGAQADYRDVVREYYKNREFWISTQVSRQVKPELTGPDAKDIERVEIKTIMKEKETESGNPVYLTPIDSVK